MSRAVSRTIPRVKSTAPRTELFLTANRVCSLMMHRKLLLNSPDTGTPSLTNSRKGVELHVWAKGYALLVRENSCLALSVDQRIRSRRHLLTQERSCCSLPMYENTDKQFLRLIEFVELLSRDLLIRLSVLGYRFSLESCRLHRGRFCDPLNC